MWLVEWVSNSKPRRTCTTCKNAKYFVIFTELLSRFGHKLYDMHNTFEINHTNAKLSTAYKLFNNIKPNMQNIDKFGSRCSLRQD